MTRGIFLQLIQMPLTPALGSQPSVRRDDGLEMRPSLTALLLMCDGAALNLLPQLHAITPEYRHMNLPRSQTPYVAGGVNYPIGLYITIA